MKNITKALLGIFFLLGLVFAFAGCVADWRGSGYYGGGPWYNDGRWFDGPGWGAGPRGQLDIDIHPPGFRH
jgi:hypothetical protein